MSPSAALRKLCSRSTGKILLAGAALLALAGCRLYESPHYHRFVSSTDPNAIRVLMIGDSLTYYNDMPGLLQQFSSREPHPIYVEKITFPLRSLRDHWNLGQAPQRVRDGHWNYVVLQDFSRKPVTDPQDCIKYYVLFSDLIKESGARPIVFENWTRRRRAREFPILMDTYNKIVQLTHGIPAPIGAAFKAAAARRPDIKLLLDDRHPTSAGSYLIAAILYDLIYHQKSADLPWTPAAPSLPQSTLQALRTLADQSPPPAKQNP